MREELTKCEDGELSEDGELKNLKTFENVRKPKSPKKANGRS